MATDVMLNSERGGHKKRRPRSKPRRNEEEDLPLSGDSHPSSTAAINDLLSNALEQSMEDGKKSKKKKKKKSSDELLMLESLRKGEGVRKDQEDRLLLANTYDPDDDKKPGKSNKRRQKEKEMKLNGQENLAYQGDDKKTKRKSKKHDDTTIYDKTMTISDLSPPPPPLLQADEDPSPRDNRKKKKKRRTPREGSRTPRGGSRTPRQGSQTRDESSDVISPRTEDEETAAHTAASADEQLLSQEDDGNTDHRGRRRKKKKKKHRSTMEEEEMLAAAYDDALGGERPLSGDQEATAAQEEEEVEPPLVIEDEGRILGLTIHRTDKLKTDFNIAHPLVRVHVVDLETGNYLKKSDKNRPVTSYFERERDSVDSILPMMTQPFDFKKNKSSIPIWEDMLILNENFNYFIQEDRPKVILLFELLDMVSMNRANQQYNNAKQEGGWYRIAWGFLKCVGANGRPNVDKKVRLQLYTVPRVKTKADTNQVFQWYKSGTRLPYPSTLYVTVKGILPPDVVEPAARSSNALQEERGHMTYDDLQRTFQDPSSTANLGQEHGGRNRKSPSPWERLPGQLCKVPNVMSLTLPSGKKGCSVIKFSQDGKSLACGCHEKDGYPIRIYEIPSGKLRCEFVGHYSIIYDLDWSKNSKQLMSASADGTARIWDCETLQVSPIKTLPHPAFVYTAKFHPRVNKVAVSGGYDKIVRVWFLQTPDTQAQLLQELEGHIGIVNTLCFDDEGSRLFTGDSLGAIRQWNVFTTEAPSKRGVLKDWTLNREIMDGEIKGLCINSLHLHRSGRRLLVHCRDNTIRMLDLRVSEKYGRNAWESGAVMQRFIGALNFRERIRSVMTPCSAFVVAGSEDSCAYMWNSETGDQVAMYTELGYRQPVADVDFHPHDHIVAFCAFGENHPILVYRYDHKAAVRSAGLLDESDAEPAGPNRPMSPTLTPGAMDRTQDDERLETRRSQVQNVSEDFAATESARLDRVMKKLNSVNTLTGGTIGDHPLAVPSSPRGAPPPPGTATMMSTWGSTFDASVLYGQTPRALASSTLKNEMASPPPSTFSPHASTSQHAQQQQQHFLGTATASSFSQIGRTGGPSTLGRGPSFSLTQGGTGGQAQFTYQGPQARPGHAEQVSGLPPLPPLTKPPPVHTMLIPDEPGVLRARTLSPAATSTPRNRMAEYRGLQVVVLYDYTAQRSDELALKKGDVVTILYKDNDNWWMGESHAGQQGFIPANYVTGFDPDRPIREQIKEDDLRIQLEPDEEEETRVSTTAVVEKGQLKFISAGEESDAEAKTHKKKKHRKPRDTTLTLEDESMPPRPHRKKKSRSKESTA